MKFCFHRGIFVVFTTAANLNVLGDVRGGGAIDRCSRKCERCNSGPAIEIYHARVADRAVRTKANFEFERNIIICIRVNRKPAIVSLVQFDQP